MQAETTREKIAILGGGMAALAAALELTSTPALRDRYEITIYQMGWRLGGKCATGRGLNGRIEEHGIHGFSGSYYNAFGLMRDCYDALPDATRRDGQPSIGVLKSFDEAFCGVDRVVMWEVLNGTLHSWPFYLAPNGMKPADYDSSMANIQAIIRGAAELLGDTIDPKQRSGEAAGPAAFVAWVRRRWRRLWAIVAYLRLLHRTGILGSGFRTLFRWFNPGLGKGAFVNRTRRLFLFINFLNSMKRGIFDPRDDIVKRGFDAIDHIDYRKWLSDHGAKQDTLESSLVYNTTDLSYAYPRGDTTQRPEMGAGTYLHWTLRMFLNLGSFIWSFRAGTGETVIAPLYHVLKHRGVKFSFFHKVTNLRLSPDRSEVVEIDIDEQATLKDSSHDYDPLIQCKDLLCWPSEPKYELLVEGDALKEKNIDLESYWSPWNAEASNRTKTLRSGTHFDKIVFAISIGAAPHLCKELLSGDEGWRKMVDAVKTCPTQSVQIWLTTRSGLLGANTAAGADESPDLPILSGTFVQPFNGQVDFTNLIQYEDWPPCGGPKSLWYFTGAMAEDETPDFAHHDFPDRQHERARHQAIQFLQATAGYLLPWSHATWSPMGLDFDLLHSPLADTAGVKRFESQFWRANIDPTERYVLAPAGSTACRLEAHDSGFANLILAGDWIYNGLNVGSFEGAVMGGKLAAHAICGSPDLSTIYGYPRRRRAGAAAGHAPPDHGPSQAPPGEKVRDDDELMLF